MTAAVEPTEPRNDETDSELDQHQQHQNQQDYEQRRLEEELERLLQAEQHEHEDQDDDEALREEQDRVGRGMLDEAELQQQEAQRGLLAPPPHATQAPWKGFTYVQSSFAIAFSLFYYAFRSRQQFYLTMVYLSSSKLSLAVFGNAFIAASTWCFDTTTALFLNGLRLQEAEGLQDFFRWNVTETCLALTMFRSELRIQTAVEFLILIWIKCIHQVAILRENHIRMTQEAIVMTRCRIFGGILGTGDNGFEIPTIPWAHIKLWMLLLGLQIIDLWVVQYTSVNLLADGPSVNILFAFEAAILLVSAWSHLLLLNLHAIDGWLHYGHEQHYPILSKFLHPWKEYKATLVFAVELQAQAIQFLFYLAFFGIVLTYYGMPINLFREVYMSFGALKERLGAFLKYRRLMANMSRFQNATEDQLEESGRICIICRDEMTTNDSKQLPICCHVFHKSCLREWLVQQQSCPTCRSDIAAMSAQEAARNAAAQAAAQRGAAPPAGGGGRAAADGQQQHAAADGQQQHADDNENQDIDTEEEGERESHTKTRDQSPPMSAHQISEAVQNYFQGREQHLRGDANVGRTATGFDVGGEDSGIPTWYFPSLYRVVREEGSAVWLDDHVVRVIPQGTVVLCQEIREDESGSLIVKIPDGWVPEEDVLHIKDVKVAPAAAAR